jgi:hypothetical protein
MAANWLAAGGDEDSANLPLSLRGSKSSSSSTVPRRAHDSEIGQRPQDNIVRTAYSKSNPFGE